MVKVITLASGAWNECKNTGLDGRINAWESSILNKLINEGWNIKDWKMVGSNNSEIWTFILEKPMLS